MKPRNALASYTLQYHPDISRRNRLFSILVISAESKMRALKVFSNSWKVGWLGVKLQLAHCRLKSSKFMSLKQWDSRSKSLKSLRVTSFKLAVWIQRVFRFSLMLGISRASCCRAGSWGFMVNPFRISLKLWIWLSFLSIFSKLRVYSTKLSRRVWGLKTPYPKHYSSTSTMSLSLAWSTSSLADRQFFRKKSVFLMCIFFFISSVMNAISPHFLQYTKCKQLNLLNWLHQQMLLKSRPSVISSSCLRFLFSVS